MEGRKGKEREIREMKEVEESGEELDRCAFVYFCFAVSFVDRMRNGKERARTGGNGDETGRDEIGKAKRRRKRRGGRGRWKWCSRERKSG